jgi:hypothetical protein
MRRRFFLKKREGIGKGKYMKEEEAYEEGMESYMLRYAMLLQGREGEEKGEGMAVVVVRSPFGRFSFFCF